MNTKIRVFHNVSQDASFGLNTVFRTGESAPEGRNSVELSDGRVSWKDIAQAPAERHELVWVFEYEVPGDLAAEVVLAQAFETFNIGTGELAQAYRARRLRSLSVGDVVMIGRRAYSCESAGWKARSEEELRILPAADAERVVRQRFEFRPAEVLSVTVPLPD